MNSNACYTYILECADGTLYTGWTSNIERRLALHNSGKGAKYTRGRLPVKLFGCWSFETRSQAMKFETWLKGLTRLEKQQFVAKGTKPCLALEEALNIETRGSG